MTGFKKGERVVIKPDSEQFPNHYGHIISFGRNIIRVRIEGAIGEMNQGFARNPGYALINKGGWALFPEELEHAD